MPILGRILRDRGIVTERQLQEAIQHQVLYGGRLGTSLYELGFITEERLQEALSKAHGVSAMPVDLREIDAQTVALVPRDMASRHKVFPYRRRGQTLFLLMIDPSDHGAVARVGFTLGYIVRPVVVPEFRMIQLLRDYYGVDERWRYRDTHRPPALAAEAPDVDTAAMRIDGASTRDEVVAGLLALCRHFFRRVLFFIVREPWVVGWAGAGDGVDRDLAQRLRFPLDEPSVFQTVTRDKAVFIGRLGPEDQNRRFLEVLEKRPATNAAVFPVLVRGRVVNLVYADNGATGNVKPSLGELLVLLQKVPRAYLRIIRRRVAAARKAVEDTAGEAEERESE